MIQASNDLDARASHRVLIADDHPLMLAGIRRALEGNDDIEIVGEARSAPELLQMIERRRPSVVLLDLNMPGASGTACIDQIAQGWPEVKMVILSACADRTMINAALDAGASAYVIKTAMPTDVASVVRQSSSDGVFHASGRVRQLRAEAPPVERGPVLTERESAILSAIASGLTTSAISKQMWVSEHTVKFHLTNIYRKLGVSNRAGAIRYALENEATAA